MKKYLIATIISLVSIQALAVTDVHAEEIVNVSANETVEENNKMQRADVIEIKYRTYNGVNQYRRWNATQNYWVDPYWINLI